MEEFYFKEKQTTLISDFLKIIKEKMPEKEIKFQDVLLWRKNRMCYLL